MMVVQALAAGLWLVGFVVVAFSVGSDPILPLRIEHRLAFKVGATMFVVGVALTVALESAGF